MKNIVKEEKGITLIALVITIIVLLILTGISIGEIKKNKNSINESKDTTASSELTLIQQAVIENYLKYIQIGNKDILKGEKMSYADAESEFNQFGSSEHLKVASYDGISETDPGLFYYKVKPEHLKDLGLENIRRKDEYIVNYSTGEVFNITQKNVSNGDLLYIYAKNVSPEYIKAGLILHLDGINNTGEGDKNHNTTTTIWKDLSGNGNDGTLCNIATTATENSGWKNDSLLLDGSDDYVITNNSQTIKELLEDGNVTVEVIYELISENNTRNSFIYDLKREAGDPGKALWYGRVTDGRRIIESRGSSGIYSTTIDINKKYLDTVVYKYDEDSGKTNILLYVNNQLLANKERNAKIINNQDKGIALGAGDEGANWFTNIKVYSFRVYNRVLTNEELEHNYEIDKSRFGIE